MEAAARNAFRHCSSAVIQACLADIGLQRPRNALQQASVLIAAYKDEWGWSEVDVARALLPLWPGAGKARKPRAPAAETDDPELAWADLASAQAILQQASAEDEPAVERRVEGAPGAEESEDATLLAAMAAGIATRGRGSTSLRLGNDCDVGPNHCCHNFHRHHHGQSR